MEMDEVIDVLNTLIEVSKDDEFGFATCADFARSPALRALLQERSEECREAVHELKLAMQRHGDGGLPTADATTADAQHRGWVAVRVRLSGYQDDDILGECERGEELALRQYADAIANPLPTDVHALVQQQLEAVSRTHDQIRRLRDELPV